MGPNDSSMLVSNTTSNKGGGTAKVLKQTDMKHLNFDAFNKHYDKNEGKNNENHRRTM